MNVLVINCGSSSIKFKVFQVSDEKVPVAVAQGSLSGLGGSRAVLEAQGPLGRTKKELPAQDHGAGLSAVIRMLQDPASGILSQGADIKIVGHRTVHGGERFTSAVAVTPEVIKQMEACIPLAPIHNPANLEGIRAARNALPGAAHVAVFDTAFHQTMPDRAFLYGLPWSLYEDHGIRRYGFHGSSCRYVLGRAAKLTGRDPEQTRMIICHIGNGVSVTAVQDGSSVDTSTGMTPMEGAMMGTRCGDLDPGVLLHLMREQTLDQVDRMLNNDSGLLGISGTSNDVRELLEAADSGNKRCAQALDVYTYRIKKYIGAYAAAMGGVDLVAFAGGVGENSAPIRQMILTGLEFMGLCLDSDRNSASGGQDRILSRDGSGADIVLVRTDEELMIAMEALALTKNSSMDRSSAIL